MTLNIAVVGATGTVGREVLSLLAEREFPTSSVTALASGRSVGSTLSHGEKDLTVKALSSYDFRGTDLVFFCASSQLAQTYIPQIERAGALVIDKSSAFRLDPAVPLCVPEVNQDILGESQKKVFASPNCVVIPLAVVLKPLMALAPLKRIVLSTYQSVSGAGREAMDELYRQTRSIFVNDELECHVFPKQIAFNVVPHIDVALKGGASGEEEKIICELKKLLKPNLKVAVTCVRVPVLIGHALSVCAEFEHDLPLSQAREALLHGDSIALQDRPQEDVYATPLECVGEDLVFVSRLRKDPSVDHGLSFWIAADNVRKGAALNAVQIAEGLVEAGRFNIEHPFPY